MTDDRGADGQTPIDEQQFGEFLKRMESPDPDERFEALSGLAAHRVPAADDAIVRAVADPDPDVVATALDALAERAHPAARRLILAQLHSRNWLVRQAALRAAGIIDISPHLEPAWRALQSRRWVERMAGAGALAKAGVTAALPALRRLAQRARAVRELAAEAHVLGSMALLGDPAGASLFLQRLSARSRSSRLAAAAFLERGDRLRELARIVGVDRLRAALLAGKAVQAASPKPRYQRRFDKLLERLEGLAAP